MTANDMRTLLRRDHDEIVQLARDMCESESGDERRALLKQLKPALFAHTRAEQREGRGRRDREPPRSPNPQLHPNKILRPSRGRRIYGRDQSVARDAK